MNDLEVWIWTLGTTTFLFALVSTHLYLCRFYERHENEVQSEIIKRLIQSNLRLKSKLKRFNNSKEK